MVKATILFADNDADFLKARVEFLEQAGYRLLTAASPAEARGSLGREEIDLAILDIRLDDDDDEKDTSGLVLAKRVARSVPKIILTGFPSYEYVREALRPRLGGLPAAADFVIKQDGPGAMLAAIERVLDADTRPKVFIVHGHDEAARTTVAHYIERLGLKPIVLRDQPRAGRTIIESIEVYSNVAFAVVLLTPDDIGGRKGASPEDLGFRARQNVVFELGFFIGRLGRDRVCVLYKEGVEIPSDYSGVLYLRMDPHEGWKRSLAREIREANIPFDLPSILEA